MTSLLSEPTLARAARPRRRAGLPPGSVIGYLIPEFPGQTHVWMWREITHLLEWGVDVRLFSTRPPPERDRARHAWAGEAERRTVYLWPRSPLALAWAVAWAALTRPRALAACVRMASRLPVERGPRWRGTLAMVPPACLLARELLRGGVRHLHVHSCANSAVVAMLAGRLAGVPYSLTLNANVEWWGGAIREKFANAAFVIAITEWLVAQAARDYPELPEGHVVLGRIGVDPRKWRPRERGARADGPWRVVTVGRLHASKGHDVLIRAVHQLVSTGSDVILRIIGAGPERERLERLSAQLGLGGRVTFAGSLGEDEIVEELGGADVFALASHAEPLGVVYMEAMAMGLPTIGTAAGGVGEIITDGVDGLLTPPGDAGALAGAIGRLAADPGLCARLGAAARETVERKLDSRLGAATLYELLFGRAPSGMAAAE